MGPPKTRSRGGDGPGHGGRGGYGDGQSREHRGGRGENRGGGYRGGRNEEHPNRGGYANHDAQGQSFANSRSGNKSRPADINTHISSRHIPSELRRWFTEGSHYLYLHGQLTHIEMNISPEQYTVVEDGDISLVSPPAAETPGTAGEDRQMVTRVAAKAVDRKGKGSAWETLLRPLTDWNPLPLEIEAFLTKHFSTPVAHRPANLSFKGVQIRNYTEYRDATSCFVCAALCDEIILKTAEQAHYLRPQTPAIRYASNITREMLSRNPQLTRFLDCVNQACVQQNPEGLRSFLVVPGQAIGDMATLLTFLQHELKATCPRHNDGLLVASVKELPLAGWVSAELVVLDYLRLVRDWTDPTTDVQKGQLKRMVDDAIIALGDPTYGSLILPTVLEYSRCLAVVVSKPSSDSDTLLQSTNDRVDNQASTKYAKFLEECANSLREAFIRCLVGGSSGSAAHSTAPDGKRQGIYITSNSCLRLLGRCGKLRNATQMFVSIDAQSPYLDFYPRAQRVTYLYYLGTYHFTNNHFFRAQLALQAAYDLCHREDFTHRRQILTYLIAANICLGRFPSQTLLSRPEATDIAPHFYPLCKIIAQGDLGTFQKHLDLNSETSQWFLRKRILLQLRNRGEVLVWRTLIQKTFRFAGHQPAGDRMVPFLRLPFVQAAAQFSLERAKAPSSRTLTKQGTFSFVTQQPTPPAEDAYTDPDLDGVDAAVNETGFDVDSGIYDDAQIGQLQSSLLTPPNEEANPSMAEVESIFSSLILQGFLRGFLTHGEKPRFAVPGSGPYGGPLVHGFPNIWQVIQGREDDTVPGWVRKDQTTKAGPFAMQAGVGAGGGGRVVNLSGARPVGAAP